MVGKTIDDLDLAGQTTDDIFIEITQYDTPTSSRKSKRTQLSTWLSSQSITVVNVRKFGAKGDADTTGVGTDDTVAIQAAVDFALQQGIRTVYLPDGRYRTTDTIHLGWGDTFRSVDLIGAERPSFGGQMPGATIWPQAIDRPAIHIQGARSSTIRGISIVGKNVTNAHNQTSSWGGTYPSDPVAWLDPVLRKTGTNPGGLQRYSPYAAIAIDGYSGTTTTASYPAKIYPAWTGLSNSTDQFNRPFSSDVTIEQCLVSGFAVGIAQSPSDSDGNGDFTRIRNTNIECCVYGIAICQGQSRNVEIRNINYGFLHTFVTNSVFGRQIGQLGGPIENVSGGQAYQFMEIGNTGSSGPVVLKNIYWEVQKRIGKWGAFSSLNFSIIFEGCSLNFGESVTKYNPSELLEVGPPAVSVIFRSCFISGITRFANLVGDASSGQGSLTLEGCTISAGEGWRYYAVAKSNAIARAYNFTAGLWFGGRTVMVGDLNMTIPSAASLMNPATPWADDTTSPIGSKIQFKTGAKRKQLHIGADEFTDDLGIRHLVTSRAQDVVSTAPGVGTPSDPFVSIITVTGGTISFTWSGVYHNTYSEYNIQPGDLLYFSGIGTLYLVTTVTAAAADFAITAMIVTNYTLDGSGNATPNANVATYTGSVRQIHTGAFIPAQVYCGDFAAGSPAVANVHRGDGYGGQIATHVAVGDLLFRPTSATDSYFSEPPYGLQVRVASLTAGSPGSITLSEAAWSTGRYPILPVKINR